MPTRCWAGEAGHGAQEGTVPVSRGIPHSAVAELTVLEYGSEKALHAIERDAERIAVVIVEPVQSRHPSLEAGGVRQQVA